MTPNNKPWITACGTEPKQEAPLSDFLADGYLALAYYVDSFEAGVASQLLPLSAERLSRLLELRVFNSECELWLHRSRIGSPFSWRVASEEFDAATRHCIETRQLLDLGENVEQAAHFDASGRRILHTVSGHAYALPIGAEDRYVRLINYLTYDENGVANAVDYRLAGFAKEGK